MKRKFYKMHGIGNDYLYFDCFQRELKSPETLAPILSDRRRSVGGDGIILVLPSKIADAKMRIFNADGSEGKMCGNGIRCVGKFLYDVMGIKKSVLRVETLSGVKTLYLTIQESKVKSVTVDMGKPSFSPREIPALIEGENTLDYPLVIDGEEYIINCLSMGNPHCVIFCKDVSKIDLLKLGPKFEKHAIFPERINTEFVEIISEREIRMRVFERGSGETFACGTGACAAAVAAVERNVCLKNTDVLVRLPGGELKVRYTDESVLLTGAAELSFVGTVTL